MSYQITRQEINILLGGDFVAVDKKGKQLPPGIRQRANGRYEGRVKVEYTRIPLQKPKRKCVS